MENKIKKELNDIMHRVARELINNGADSLYKDGQNAIGGTITIQINEDMMPTIEYKREVIV